MSAADELVARTAGLTSSQLVSLAEATRRRIGRGLHAYLGVRTGVDPAVKAATAAISRTGRTDELHAKAAPLEEAVLTAAIAAASTEGRDTEGVLTAWREFQNAVDSDSSRDRQRAFRACRRQCRRGLGRSLARAWPTAGIGAGWALIAVVSWDLVAENGPYTPEHRDALVRPWIDVADLPPPS